MREVHVYGGGLAGCEAAHFLLRKGYRVFLHERRPAKGDPIHKTGNLAELVCSNSLKSERLDNACGLLKEEMLRLGSLTIEIARKSRLGAGNALAVDRELFSKLIEERLRSFPGFHLVEEEIETLPEKGILATGPLTDGKLLESLESLGNGTLHFFDATAPIVEGSSLDRSIVYSKNRFEEGEGDYLNCPFDDRADYFAFVDELTKATRAVLHEGDDAYFEGCMPIEVLASRGVHTLRYGPLSPVGLEQPGKRRPYAAVQLRKESLLGDAYGLVGFQTNLTYPEQKRVFSLIPGMKDAKFIRYGLMHRNHYISSPELLNENLSFKHNPELFAAGQLIGVEGYVESAAAGLVAAIYYHMNEIGNPFEKMPVDTMIGALANYVVNADPKRFSPMQSVFSLLPPCRKDERLVLAEACLKRVEEYARRIP